MLLNIIQFIFVILFPYFIEEFAYKKFVVGNNPQTKVVIQTYGWRIVWDIAYFLVILGVGYQIIFLRTTFTNWQWFGYIIFLCGIGLRIWSLKEVGDFYDSGIAIKTNHQMVKTGPYRILRHPLHLGTLFKISGLAFFSPVWIAIPVVIVSLLLGLSLNRTEDHTHIERLGESFKEYYLSTWDIVDFIFWKKNHH